MNKTYQFAYNVGGRTTISITAPFENGFVQTNRFRPANLMGPLPFLASMQAGEAEDEFIQDCKNQVNVMGVFSTSISDDLERHIQALQYVVKKHFERSGRLIYTDLLVYVDIFAYLLYADGIPEAVIQNVIYPRVTLSIVDEYGDGVKNPFNLASLRTTPLYSSLKALVPC